MEVPEPNKDAWPHICLFRPLIPQNTGNIARTCAGTNTPLHLIRPLGFTIDDTRLKRAGLDYWPSVNLNVHDDFSSMLKCFDNEKIVLLSTKGGVNIWDYDYRPGSLLVFGAETSGLPQEIMDLFPHNRVKIPINSNIRSLNLSTSVAITLYTVLWKLNLIDGINLGQNL